MTIELTTIELRWIINALETKIRLCKREQNMLCKPDTPAHNLVQLNIDNMYDLKWKLKEATDSTSKIIRIKR